MVTSICVCVCLCQRDRVWTWRFLLNHASPAPDPCCQSATTAAASPLITCHRINTRFSQPVFDRLLCSLAWATGSAYSFVLCSSSDLSLMVFNTVFSSCLRIISIVCLLAKIAKFQSHTCPPADSPYLSARSFPDLHALSPQSITYFQ